MKNEEEVLEENLGETPVEETGDSSRERALNAAALADEKHAGNITVIYIGALSSVADYIVVCDGASDRQVKATSEFIIDEMKHKGARPIGVEGLPKSHWVLIDYGDVVVHVFHAPVREYFDIEGLWADAPRVSFDSDRPATDKAEE